MPIERAIPASGVGLDVGALSKNRPWAVEWMRRGPVRPVAALGVVARRLPLAVTGAVQRFVEDPERAWMAFTRAFPLARSWRGSPGAREANFDQAVAADQWERARLLAESIDEPMDNRGRDISIEISMAVLSGDVREVSALRLSGPGGARRRRTVRSARRRSRELRQALPVWAAGPRASVAGAPSGALRIMHVVTNSLPQVQAGSTIRTQRIAEHQRERGWDARVVTRPGFPVFHGGIAAPNPEFIGQVPYDRLLPSVLPSRSRFESAYVELLDQRVDHWRPDILHAASDAMNARACLQVGRSRDIPVAYEARTLVEYSWAAAHGGRAAYNTDTFGWMSTQHTEVMRAADVVTTLGESMKQHIIGRGVDPDRVFVVPNAIPESYLRPGYSAAEARQALMPQLISQQVLTDENVQEWTGADLVVGSVSTMYAYEGFDTLIEAVALLRARGIRATVLLVGEGPALAGWRHLANDRGVPLIAPGRVPVEDVLPYMDALDVCALPRVDADLTRWVTALKPLEVQARARPVVGSDLPAVVEVLAPGADVVASTDVSAWAATLSPYTDEIWRSQRGDLARDWVAACRTWPRVMSGYASAYASLGYPDLV